ncbi:MAG: hypothetical protein VR73_06895 [Gammaproteobacteria bacterium BRH_c0]|nr:MAG: hypothetical protein VR73_06895 [Gammaproteobacteria bacterium BRH_c0]
MPTTPLQLFNLENNYELAFPNDFDDVDLNSPAQSILTDFKTHQPATVYLDSTVDEARHFLANAHSAVLPVVDSNQHFRGLISEEGLGEEAVMRLVSSTRKRPDIQVRDLMVSREQIMAIDYESLGRTTVAKLISLLRREGQPYVLVVDHNSTHIRGLISAADLARRLHLPVEIHQHQSFIEIFDAVMH